MLREIIDLHRNTYPSDKPIYLVGMVRAQAEQLKRQLIQLADGMDDDLKVSLKRRVQAVSLKDRDGAMLHPTYYRDNPVFTDHAALERIIDDSREEIKRLKAEIVDRRLRIKYALSEGEKYSTQSGLMMDNSDPGDEHLPNHDKDAEASSPAVYESPWMDCTLEHMDSYWDIDPSESTDTDPDGSLEPEEKKPEPMPRLPRFF